MTVTATYEPEQYTGTGANTVLPVTFTFDDTSDLVVTSRVTATGVETVLVENTHYTVAGGGGGTGSVTPVDGATDFPATVTWTISRDTPVTQETNWVEGDTFPAASHEEAADKLTRLAQERDWNAARALRVPESDDVALDMELPSSIDRASMSLGFDADGEPIALAGTVSGDVVVTGFMEGVLDDGDADIARATLVAQEDVITTQGDLVIGDATPEAARLALGDAGEVLTSDGTDVAWAEAPWPPYYISGFEMSGPTGTAWEINIGVGAARAHTTPGTTLNTKNGSLVAAGFTKKLHNAAGTWVAGSGNNGLAEGETKSDADWFAAFLMVKSTDGSVDIGFDSDVNAANLKVDTAVVAAGFDRFRFIGWVQCNSAGPTDDVEPFFYDPDSGYWQYLNTKNVSLSFADHEITLDLPEGNLDVALRTLFLAGSGEIGVSIHHPSSSDAAQASVENYQNTACCLDATATAAGSGAKVLRCDDSLKVHWDVNAAVNDAETAMHGFYVKRSDR